MCGASFLVAMIEEILLSVYRLLIGGSPQAELEGHDRDNAVLDVAQSMLRALPC